MKLLKKIVAISLLTTMGFSARPTDAALWEWFERICVSLLVVDYGCGAVTRVFSNNPRMLHDMILGR